MFSHRCFKENCKNKLCAKCDCEEKVFLCQEHILEHVSKPSPKGHQCMHQIVRPTKEVKQLAIQKLLEIKKDIQVYKKETLASSNEVRNSFENAFQRYLEQIREIDKSIHKMIKGLLTEIEFVDISSEDDMESVLKLDAQRAKTKMLWWNINCCRLDYKGIIATLSKTYEIPFNPFNSFGGAVEDEIESNELSFFRQNTTNFSTINLDNFQVSAPTTLETHENIGYTSSTCILPDKTYFYCCNPNSNTGMSFKINKDKNVEQLQKSKVNTHLDPVFYNGFIYLLGGNNKLAERYDFKQNLWESMAPLPQGLNYNYSCNALFGDLILISAYNLQKMICYNIAQNSYKDVPNLVLESCSYKFMLRGNNRIYVFERFRRIFESAENNIFNWVHIGNNMMQASNYHLYSAVVRYKGSIYFVEMDSKLWKFDLSSKQVSPVKSI